jgi:ubiquinol-cytochrome c reductase iron-sulfur subunit
MNDETGGSMSTHDPDHADHSGSGVATRTDDLPAHFDNPGLPVHQHRMADTDPKAAKRAERQVATLFGLSMIGTLLVLVSYFAVKLTDHDRGLVGNLEHLRLSNQLLGIGLAIALLGIGAGAVHWAKTLMPDEERVEYRHLQRGTDEERAEAVAILKTGAEESGVARRPLIRNTLIGAMALFPIPGLVLLRDTGPMPGKHLSETIWKAGDRLIRDQPGGGALKASDLTVGSVVHVMPEGIEKAEHPLDERAKAALLLIRLEPELLDAESRPGSFNGIVAYSKICTHMGCPVALYEQRTHHLLCPCHQSTFDLTQNCKVIFGPAKRPLPQLAITVDDEGYLVAKDGFTQAVGPSFWERG